MLLFIFAHLIVRAGLITSTTFIICQGFYISHQQIISRIGYIITIVCYSKHTYGTNSHCHKKSLFHNYIKKIIKQ